MSKHVQLIAKVGPSDGRLSAIFLSNKYHLIAVDSRTYKTGVRIIRKSYPNDMKQALDWLNNRLDARLRPTVDRGPITDDEMPHRFW